MVMLVSGCATPTIKSTSKIQTVALGVVAVLPFQGFRGDQFADAVTQELLMRNVKIVERTQITYILLEQGMNITDITEGKINYTKLGGLLGVDTIVVGSVSPITVYLSGVPSEKVSSASMRLISVKTGAVIGASSYSANTDLLAGSALYPNVAERLVKSIIEESYK
jgi:hypothetical protein